MDIRFLGAVRTTTGSMHLVEAGRKKILLDCGLYQGRRKEAFEKNRNFPFYPGDIDFCVLSHAHIDHSGNLPSLVKQGYGGSILSTPATADLCRIMLLDSAHIQEQDVSFVNKRRASQGRKLFEPLYEREDALETLERFETLEYESPGKLCDGISVEFYDAGHILGSALTMLSFNSGAGRKKILFTGDLGRKDMPILKNPVVPAGADTIITESTYGDRLHQKETDVEDTLKNLVRRVAKRKSRLIIPAFSVGRTQQIVYILNKLNSEGLIPTVPAFVDSPLSFRATEVYAARTECYDDITREQIEKGNSPFEYRGMRYIKDVEESKKLNDVRGPVIIISASGMCEAGRILHHLAHSAEDENNIILITGFQARNTLGRRLLKKEPKIKIFGDEYNLRAEVEVINALSAHADKDALLEAVKAAGGNSAEVFIVHGEEEASESLAEALKGRGAKNVKIPRPMQCFEV